MLKHFFLQEKEYREQKGILYVIICLKEIQTSSAVFSQFF